jgi:hypothetical protein
MVLATLLFTDFVNSPYIVPVAGCFMILGIVAVSVWSGTRQREMESQERLAAIAKGLVPPPTSEELALTNASQGRPGANAVRRRTVLRTGALVLIGTGVGIILTCALIAFIVGERDVLCGSAAGLIPLGIGAGLFIDAHLQTREIEAAASTQHE